MKNRSKENMKKSDKESLKTSVELAKSLGDCLEKFSKKEILNSGEVVCGINMFLILVIKLIVAQGNYNQEEIMKIMFDGLKKELNDFDMESKK